MSARLDEIRARLAACDLTLYSPQYSTDGKRSEHYRKVFVDDHGDGKFVAEFNPYRMEWVTLLLATPDDLAFLLAEVERLTGERDEAVAALKDVGGPLCECGHEGDLYHYTDGGRECTVRDCACVGLRWSKR